MAMMSTAECQFLSTYSSISIGAVLFKISRVHHEEAKLKYIIFFICKIKLVGMSNRARSGIRTFGSGIRIHLDVRIV